MKNYGLPAKAPKGGQSLKRLGRKPGPKETFTLADAVKAACDKGIASFTMRDVARSLGVQPAALYRVCGSREDLQFEALKVLAAKMESYGRQADTWQECLRNFVDAQWLTLEEHPELAIVINTRFDAFVAALPQLTRTMEQLTDLGIPGGMKMASFVVDFVGDTTFTTFMQLACFRTLPGEEQGVRQRLLEAMGPNPDVFDIANLPERGNLDAKVEFIIAGVEKGLVETVTH